MSKKNFFSNMLPLLMAATLCVLFPSCGGGDDDDDEELNPNNGTKISPTADVPDPEGTILLSMRNANNGKTILGNRICIINENFGDADGSDYNAPKYVDIGAVKGLGNISKIPTIGWAKQVAVVPGHGYVAWDNGVYYRIFVISEIAGTSGGVIGAEIKYQTPFNGIDEAIQLPINTLTLDGTKRVSIGYKEYDGETIYFTNENIVKFEVKSDKDWCRIEVTSNIKTNLVRYMGEWGFLYNGIKVYCDANGSIEPRESTVTITTAYGRETCLKVIQLGKTE